MIARNEGSTQHLPVELSWKQSLASAYSDPLELLDFLDIDPSLIALDNAPKFPFRVPREFALKMQAGDINDPLLRQVLPLAEELSSPSGYSHDPVAEAAFEMQPGLLQKYKKRALIIATGACAINCRYCFRRNFPYQQATGKDRWRKLVMMLKMNTDVEEIILSGGDPLLMDDAQLKELCDELGTITQLKRLRIHTRIPVTIPTRLTAGLQDLLTQTRLDVAFVIHSNHANEIDEALSSRLRALHRAGVNLFNQSVLLRAVNDDVAVLSELSEALFSANVIPYYLHLLDPVIGSAHFDLPLTEAKQLEQKLRANLPGYLVPTFVREIPHKDSKTPIIEI